MRMNGHTPGLSNLEDARQFIARAEAELLKLTTLEARARWTYSTYITTDTELILMSESERLITATVRLIHESLLFNECELPEHLSRKLMLLKQSLSVLFPEEPELRLDLLRTTISLVTTYSRSRAHIQYPTQEELDLETLSERMAKSRDPEELKGLWLGWHEIGKPLRSRFERLVKLSNHGAMTQGFHDSGSLWQAGYDMPSEAFRMEVDSLWMQIRPLYLDLHSYVRRRLVENYGEVAQRPDGLIPAHLLGDTWAQHWGNLASLLLDRDLATDRTINDLLRAKNLSPRDMVRYGEEFFLSLGMDPLPPAFWCNSLFEKPRDRDIVTHPSAAHIDGDLDVRLKMCVDATGESFKTIHHELGHIYYYLAYRAQPFLFKRGANDGVHEAIGDTIGLSMTPGYRRAIGLCDALPDADDDIASLLAIALEKLAFLPFALTMDKWRWDVFSGAIQPTDYTQSWWDMRAKYQGIAPPVDRSENDFDPGAKFHICANIPYIRYFLSHVYQFQFHRSLCRASGQTAPLHRCSIYGSKVAGEKLKSMMAMGCSEPWQHTLRKLAEEPALDASALLEYFQPLREWLREQDRGDTPGSSVKDAQAQETSYDSRASMISVV